MNTTALHDKTVTSLIHLLTTCHDGIDGYHRAADDLADSALRSFLLHAAAEREELASVLTNILVELGHKPTQRGSVPAVAHRRWLDVVGAVGRGSARAVLHECQRGERKSLSVFTDAMGGTMLEEVRAKLGPVFSRLVQANAALDRAAAAVDGRESAPHASGA